MRWRLSNWNKLPTSSSGMNENSSRNESARRRFNFPSVLSVVLVLNFTYIYKGIRNIFFYSVNSKFLFNDICNASVILNVSLYKIELQFKAIFESVQSQLKADAACQTQKVSDCCCFLTSSRRSAKFLHSSFMFSCSGNSKNASVFFGQGSNWRSRI